MLMLILARPATRVKILGEIMTMDAARRIFDDVEVLGDEGIRLSNLGL